ncbi:hypothetical protein Q8A73_000046 [Channa argus]|nr:hypothetical protein Q8A73_000046 [Channa argus]
MSKKKFSGSSSQARDRGKSEWGGETVMIQREDAHGREAAAPHAEPHSRKQHLRNHMHVHSDKHLFSCSHCYKVKVPCGCIWGSHTGDRKRPSCAVCGLLGVQRSPAEAQLPNAGNASAGGTNGTGIHTRGEQYQCSLCQLRFRFRCMPNIRVQTHTGNDRDLLLNKLTPCTVAMVTGRALTATTHHTSAVKVHKQRERETGFVLLCDLDR